MCSLNLYNWYENRFPNDFSQLIKIKHYSISDLSFLLSKVWCKLDYGEKLLMCAIYYDDFDLAKQMLDEKFIFHVNPFYGKRYITKTPQRTYLSSSGCSFSYCNNTDFFNHNNDILNIPESPLIPHTCQLSSNNSSHNNNSNKEDECWCLKGSKLNNHRMSFSSYTNLESILNDGENGQEQSDENPVQPSVLNRATSLFDNHIRNIFNVNENNQNLLSDEPIYFFDQIFYDFHMQSPFYFAVKLNKIEMCQLFIDKLKSIFLHSLNSVKSRRQNNIFLKVNERDSSIYYHHKKCINSYLSNKKFKIYLNSMLSDEELSNLLVLSLSNKNYDIAMLLLSNVNNPKKILNFQTLNESFIYNKEFCLFLIKNRIVEPHLLLKEATNRHSAEITNLIIDYLEQDREFKNKANELFNIYKVVLKNSISIGDLNIFRYALDKINTHLQKFKVDEERLKKFSNDLTIENILSENGSNKSIKKRKRSLTNHIDSQATKEMAIEKEFDWDSYFSPEVAKPNSTPTTLSHLNRLRLLKYLFNKSNKPNSYLNSAEQIKNELAKLWLNMETLIKKNLNSFDKLFASDETIKCKLASHSNITSKRIYLGHYLVLNESEAFLVNEIIKNAKDSYKLTNRDLISVAKNCSSELTLYYLLNNLEFSNQNESMGLLKPMDDLYGNFLEIIFCRMVRCTKNHEQETRLKHLFLEAVLLKNAKMTCTTNILNLFLTNNTDIKLRLVNKYFPCLFYLSNSLQLFESDVYYKRFGMLTQWLTKHLFFMSHKTNNSSNLTNLFQFDRLNRQQIEMILFEYYKKLYEAKQITKQPEQVTLNNFELSLKELARISFLKVYVNHDQIYSEFINEINESTRQFIFFFNEIKHLLS